MDHEGVHNMIYLKNVATIEADQARCTGCGKCLEVCPRRVLELKERKIRVHERDACIECGACAKNCPVKALKVAAGVGCAAAIFNSMIWGGQPSCGCGDDSSCCD